jgi:hypothetical protein
MNLAYAKLLRGWGLRLSVIVAAAAFTGTPARAALIQHMTFDGNANATVGTNGTLQSSSGNLPTFGADRNNVANAAVAFNGSTFDRQYVEVPGGGGLNNLAAGTIAMFVRWNGFQPQGLNGTTFGTVTARQSNGLFSDQVITLNGPDPATAKIEFRMAAAFSTSLASSISPGDGIWHHLAVTYDTNVDTVSMYVDGVLSASGVGTRSIHNNPAVPLSIGAWIGDGNTWSGSNVDDFRVYDTVLNADEVVALAFPQAPEPGVLGLLGVAVTGALGARRHRA